MKKAGKHLVTAILLALVAALIYYTVVGAWVLFWLPIYLSR